MNAKASKPELAAATDASPEGAWRRKTRATSLVGWGLVLAGLLVIAGFCIVTATLTVRHARSLQEHVQVLEPTFLADTGNLDQIDLDSTGQHLTGMRQDLEAIQAGVGPLLPAGRWLRWVPRHGGDLAAAAELLDVATRLSIAGDRVFVALAPALEQVVGEQDERGPMLSVGERLLPLLAEAQPELRTAQDELAAVQQLRDRIDAQGLSPQVAGLLERLDRAMPWMETAVDGALLAPGLLGDDGPRTYLILAQNNHELRATGGFISGVGELRVEEGRLASLSFSDSYAVDNPETPRQATPPAFQQTLFGQLWFFRDANWDADFPTSARRAMELYERDRGVQADGVIALDLTALQLLLGAVGPVEVPGIAEPVAGDNVQQLIQSQWAEPIPGVDPGQGAEWWLHRKDFLGQIAGATMDRLLTAEEVPLAELAQALVKALDEKRILIYLADARAAGLLHVSNWDGALPDLTEPSDLLMVVDSNVGFNKVDPNVVRSLQYQVDLGGADGPRARATLTYRHLTIRPVGACLQEARYGDTYATMMDRCYWDYVRVYVPAGSQWLNGPSIPLPAGSLLARSGHAASQYTVGPAVTEAGRTAWAAFFDLEPMAERTLAFEYQLPPDVLERTADQLVRYRLRVQKQPGTEAVPLHVEFMLPSGAELLSAAPADLPWLLDVSPAVSTDLRTDRFFEILFREGRER